RTRSPGEVRRSVPKRVKHVSARSRAKQASPASVARPRRRSTSCSKHEPEEKTMTNIDFAAITERQKATWSEGDFHVLALAVNPASEAIVDALDVHAGERVLDVACGSGNAALVAARRNADVTGIDYVPALVERAKLRAHAE